MNLPALLDKDPHEVGFPPTLPLEIAARTQPIKDICAGYGISREEYEALKANPTFQKACEEALATVNEPGGVFKLKAKVMAEGLLPRLYQLANSEDYESVPASVQAQLIQTAIKVAGLDASIEQKGAAQGKAMAQNPLQIQINLR